MGCLASVQQDKIAVVEKGGEFQRFLEPGFNVVGCWPYHQVAGELKMRQMELNLKTFCKTKNNVFVFMEMIVQYMVDPSQAYTAFYTLNDVSSQIKAYVNDSIIGIVSKIELDELFTTQREIAESVQLILESLMKEYGYKIIDLLLIDIKPNSNVVNSMNNINRVRRLRMAQVEVAEMNRIKIVKAAEANMMEKQLQGEGLARQRKILIEGLRDSVYNIKDQISIDKHNIMSLILLSQYLDTLKEISKKNNSKTVFYTDANDENVDSIDELRTILVQAKP